MTPISCRSVGEELNRIEKLIGYICVDSSFWKNRIEKSEASIRNFLLFANSSTSIPCRKWLCLKVSHREQAMFSPLSRFTPHISGFSVSHQTRTFSCYCYSSFLLLSNIHQLRTLQMAVTSLERLNHLDAFLCAGFLPFTTTFVKLSSSHLSVAAIYAMLHKNSFVWTEPLPTFLTEIIPKVMDTMERDGSFRFVSNCFFRGPRNSFANTANNNIFFCFLFHTVDK
jgi:hypothetical protein